MERTLLKAGIYQPDSSLLAARATKMLLPEPTRKHKASRVMKEKNIPLGERTLSTAFLTLQESDLHKKAGYFSQLLTETDLWLSVGETEVLSSTRAQIVRKNFVMSTDGNNGNF